MMRKPWGRVLFHRIIASVVNKSVFFIFGLDGFRISGKQNKI